MKLYLDASVLVALLAPDPLSERADTLLAQRPSLIVSDFAAAEFASARVPEITGIARNEMRALFERFRRGTM